MDPPRRRATASATSAAHPHAKQAAEGDGSRDGSSDALHRDEDEETANTPSKEADSKTSSGGSVAASSTTAASGKTNKSRSSKQAGGAALSPTMKRFGAILVVGIVGLVLLLRLTHGGFGGGDGDDDGMDEDEDGNKIIVRPPSQKATKPRKDEKLLSGAQVIEMGGKTGWTPQMGWLVEKRPPRPCPRTKITKQVTEPIVYMSAARKGWKRRAFVCLLKKCRAPLIEDALDRQWKQMATGNKKELDATFVWGDAATLQKHPRFEFVYWEREGSTYLDVILGVPTDHPNKEVPSVPLSVPAAANPAILYASLEREFSKRGWGCSFNDLNVATLRGFLNDPKTCAEMRDVARKNLRLTWALWTNAESPTGATSSTLSSSDLLNKLGTCGQTATTGASEFVVLNLAKPLIVEKMKFTVRAYMLIGGTMPFMAFLGRGFVKTSGKSNSDLSLEEFQRLLANGRVTGTHFVDTFLNSSIKRVAWLLFHASRRSMKRRRGSYQLYSLDFVIDDQLRVWFDKLDPYPDLKVASEEIFDPSLMMTEMHDLVMELAEEPTAFETMVTGDKYGSLELIFSETRESCEGVIYNPCHAFVNHNQVSLAKPNKRISGVHNAANREHHEETRVVKKLEEEKKARCKEQKLSVESKSCDKLQKQFEDAEFERLFAEHEKEWNVNSFRMPKPGEVFPYETV